MKSLFLFLVLLSWIPEHLSQENAIFLSDCIECCAEIAPLFGFEQQVLENLEQEACEEACDVDLENNLLCPPGNENLGCQVGLDFRITGFAEFEVINSDPQVLISKFCVDGSVEDTQAPTVSPTPPTKTPTKSPTEKSLPISAPESSVDLTVYIGASVGGLFVLALCLGALLFLLPKRKRSSNTLDSKAVLDEYGLTQKPRLPKQNAALTVAPPTVLGDGLTDFKRIKTELNEERLTLVGFRGNENNLINFKNFTPLVHELEFNVMYDFKAESKDELSVNREDVVFGVAQINQDWWIVKNQAGFTGIVPRKFMEERLPDLGVSQTTSKQKEDDEISF